MTSAGPAADDIADGGYPEALKKAEHLDFLGVESWSVQVS